MAAEGRVAAYSGAEVFVGTDLAGTVVILNVGEKNRVRKGQILTAEGYDGEFWKGRVGEFPDAVGGHRLKSQDPGKPEDTRVLLVEVALLEPTPLKLGQRVEIRIQCFWRC